MRNVKIGDKNTEEMAPSITLIPMWLFFVSRWTLIMFLEPLQQTRADRRSANETWSLSEEVAVEYCSSFFEAMHSANLQWNLGHYFPTPPVVVKTKNQWGERSSFHIKYSSRIPVLFLVLMYPIDLLGVHVPVRDGIRVTNPHIK